MTKPKVHAIRNNNTEHCLEILNDNDEWIKLDEHDWIYVYELDGYMSTQEYAHFYNIPFVYTNICTIPYSEVARIEPHEYSSANSSNIKYYLDDYDNVLNLRGEIIGRKCDYFSNDPRHKLYLHYTPVDVQSLAQAINMANSSYTITLNNKPPSSDTCLLNSKDLWVQYDPTLRFQPKNYQWVEVIDQNHVKLDNKSYFLWDDILEVKFVKLNKTAITPTRKHATDAGLDFYTPLDYTDTYIQPNNFILVHTGIAIETPKGYMLKLLDNGKAIAITGSGVVDAGYEGEIVVKMYNTTDTVIRVSANQKICQGVYIPIATPKVKEVTLEEFRTNSDRGTTGGIHNL